MLNEEQQRAVSSTAKVTVVIAGPGAGKTRTIEARIRKLVDEGVDPACIVVLTFTNGAAHNLAIRLAPIVIGYIGTIHGYMIRLLQRFGSIIGYRAGTISIVTEELKEELLLETKKRLGSKITQTALLAKETEESQLIWNEYRHTLKRTNMIDYDQILVDGLILLHHREVCDALNVVELLVEEAQDSGAIDWDIFSQIPAARKFIVGDPDQSIYGFRGGDPSSLVMAALREGTNWVSLPYNYRSDAAICRAATKLIEHNSTRVDKPILPAVLNGPIEEGAVCGLEYQNGEEEIFGCLGWIRNRLPTPDYNEIAILSRTNALADRAREVLRGFGLPVKSAGKPRLPEDWSFALSVINLLQDPQNDHHAERVMRAIDNSQINLNVAKLKAMRDHVPLAQVSLSALVAPAPFSETMTKLALIGVSDDSLELIKQRIKILPNPMPTLSDLLADLWKHDTWQPEEVNQDGVTVSTIHAAKGKEWDMVIVIGCEEGILPHGGTSEKVATSKIWPPQSIEEERRLFFVAITRARHTLVLTHALRRTAYGKTSEQRPSRFLQEINDNE